MSRETIPERTIVTCDICRIKCDESLGILRSKKGYLAISGIRCFMDGDGGTRELDLCDGCLENVKTAIEKMKGGPL